MARPRTATDEQIIEATVRAIGKHGPARLTLAHVAAEVGITPGAIVQRFGSKQALLLAVGEIGAGQIEAAVDAALARHAPLEALYRVLVDQVRPLRTTEEMANHMAFLHLDLADPDLRRRARSHARGLLGGIRQLVDAATAAGQLTPGPADERAVAVYTTYNGALISWALVGKGSLASWVRHQLDVTLAPHRPAAAAAGTPKSGTPNAGAARG